MKTVEKIDYIGALLKKGGTLEEYETSPDRGKMIGRMWRGRARIQYYELTFIFDLWHHGSDTETDESLRPKFKLSGVGIHNDDRYFDASWNCIPATDGIYMHPSGWFRNRELANHAIILALPNRNIWSVELTEGEKAVLGSLGFSRVVAL